MSVDSFATDYNDDDFDTCAECHGKRLLEQWPDKKYVKCFNCPYKDEIKKQKEKHDAK